MSHPQRAARVVSAVLALSLATVAPGAVGPGQAEATGNQEKYLGRWNYDQPDRASMRNVAVFYGTGFQLQIPQIGDIVFSPDTEGRIVGRTDQGCMWRFKALPDSLRLDPPSQTCHNPTSNGSYTIDTWSVTVSGRHEKEILTATSHHADGDYEFKLENGSRTNVDEYDPRSVAQFPGVWAYDAADPRSRANIRTTQIPGGNPVESPQSGLVTFTRDRDNRIIARTDDGCTWTLAVRGNTAKLDPPAQTCSLGSSTVTLKFWTIASDGKQQSSVISGVDEHGGGYLVPIGSLTKQRSS